MSDESGNLPSHDRVSIVVGPDGRTLCDPPDGCPVCVLFGDPGNPAWLAAVQRQAGVPLTSKWERKRQVPAPAQLRPRPKRAASVSQALSATDLLLIDALAGGWLTRAEIAERIGVRVTSVEALIGRARRRGAAIENMFGKGYRLRQERSA